MCIECKEEIDRLKHRVDQLESYYDNKFDEIFSKLREDLCEHDFKREYGYDEIYEVCEKCGFEIHPNEDDDDDE